MEVKNKNQSKKYLKENKLYNFKTKIDKQLHYQLNMGLNK